MSATLRPSLQTAALATHRALERPQFYDAFIATVDGTESPQRIRCSEVSPELLGRGKREGKGKALSW
jgi:hypothetical protein